MAARRLHDLAQDLEWLGCELEHYGQLHAHEGFPEEGPTWDTFLEKQRGVLITAQKIEHDLQHAVRFNPRSLLGVDYPLEAAFEALGTLLEGVEEIKRSAIFAVHTLPEKVRAFSRMVDTYLRSAGAVAG
jgi:DNA-directed RNA polymerase subunit L